MTPPEDRVISMFAGLLANHDRAHSQQVKSRPKRAEWFEEKGWEIVS